MKDLIDKCKQIRRDIFTTAFNAKTGHIAPAFSCVELMVSLYFGGVLKYDVNDQQNVDRDRFILSKGHACLALYAVLAEAGFFSKDECRKYCSKDSMLGGHPRMDKISGVEATTGALGHGLLYATGIALAGKIDKKEYHTYVILGDGECQEGSVWEAALFAAHNKLNNLTAIIDYNKLQAMDALKNIISMESMVDKWKAFGWNVYNIDGHDILQIMETYNIRETDKPKLIVANTIKGKGVSFMENKPLWHYRFPNEEELHELMKELEIVNLDEVVK